jgi:tRNA-specific adenosine deaminase 1
MTLTLCNDKIFAERNRTGLKCLPRVKVPGTRGCVLHDWHAEVLALRAFNHFLLQECLSLLESRRESSTVLQRTVTCRGDDFPQPFSVREDVKIHMYCSEAPCGDSSMELVMKAQEDATPWPIPSCERAEAAAMELRGRENFSELGIVRRKPGQSSHASKPQLMLSRIARGDSLTTLSKSCSDKLALKQCTSLLNSDTITLINPERAYLETVILPQSQYLETSFSRAFGTEGRMKPVVGKIWPGGFNCRPFDVRTTVVNFDFSRHHLFSPKGQLKSSNISAVWTPSVQETLINGVLQGRKQDDPRGASAVSRKRMYDLAYCISNQLDERSASEVVPSDSIAIGQRRLVKDDVTKVALKGWIRNCQDGFENSR